MPYSKISELASDIKKAYEDLKLSPPPELERNFAFLYYRNAYHQSNKGGLTIGLIPNLTEEVAELGSIFDGGRMCVGDGWKIHYNDAFILGGIHGHCDFKFRLARKWINPSDTEDPNRQLVTKEEAKKHLTPDSKISSLQLDYIAETMIPVSYGCLKVTQRELAALNIFGYSSKDEGKDRMFTLQNKGLADGATMTEYLKHIKDLQEAIKKGK